jgi:ligand-binding sensor domain-containing protein
MSGPQGYTKKQSRLQRQKVDASDISMTASMTSAGSETLELGMVAQKLTLSTTGGLVASASFTIDGVNFFGTMTINSTPASYSTNLVKSVKITWTSGAGIAVVAAV